MQTRTHDFVRREQSAWVRKGTKNIIIITGDWVSFMKYFGCCGKNEADAKASLKWRKLQIPDIQLHFVDNCKIRSRRQIQSVRWKIVYILLLAIGMRCFFCIPSNHKGTSTFRDNWLVHTSFWLHYCACCVCYKSVFMQISFKPVKRELDAIYDVGCTRWKLLNFHHHAITRPTVAAFQCEAVCI